MFRGFLVENLRHFIEFDSVSDLKDFYEIRDALSQRQVSLLNQAADDMELQPSCIRTEGGKRIRNPGLRVSEIGWLPNERHHLWVYRKLGELTNIANNATWKFAFTGMTERVQLTHCSADNNGHFDWHIDLGAGSLSRRKISLSILLSNPDDYDGGDLGFFTGRKNNTAGREQGTAILFPDPAAVSCKFDASGPMLRQSIRRTPRTIACYATKSCPDTCHPAQPRRLRPAVSASGECGNGFRVA